MRGKIARRTLPLLGLALLGGCQILAPGNRAHVATQVQNPDMSSYFAQLLAQGRSHLQANRPAAALIAYRQASHDPASRAAAFNGLAIAYDRIGRPDLAQRYFLEAVALEPGNPSFVANLARLNGNQALLVEATAARAAAAALQQQDEGQDESAATAATGLQRVSEQEVRLATRSADQGQVRLAPTGMPSVVRIERRPQAAGPRQRSYPVSVPLAVRAAEAGAAGERVAASGTSRRSVSVRLPGPRAPNYPVRVRLDQS